MPLFSVSDEEAALLREVVQAFRGTRRNRPVPPPDLEHQPAPEVYLARAPTTGIAAMNPHQTGTGTTDFRDDVLGQATCEVYRRNIETGRPEPAGFDLLVYNPHEVAIPANLLIQIARDKFGDWYVLLAFRYGSC